MPPTNTTQPNPQDTPDPSAPKFERGQDAGVRRALVTTMVVNAVRDARGLKAQDEIGLGQSFRDDLDFDSLDDVEFVMLLEDEFGISIPDEDAEKCITVNDAITYCARRVAERLGDA